MSPADTGVVRKAVVPVAGAGTRLFPASKSQPKEMLPVGRKPVVQYVVEELLSAGVEQVLLVTGAKKSAIEDHFDQDAELSALLRESGELDPVDLAIADGVSGIFYTRQGAPTGVADAVGLARDFVGAEPFAVAFGDTIIRGPDLLRRMIGTHHAAGAGCTVAVEEVAPEDAYRYGIIDPQPAGDGIEVRGLVEKPSPGRAPSNLAVVPRYVFSPAIFDAIEATRPGLGGERWLTDSIAILIREAPPVRAERLHPDERRYDIGNFESYFKTFIEFAAADERYGASIRQYIAELGREL